MAETYKGRALVCWFEVGIEVWDITGVALVKTVFCAEDIVLNWDPDCWDCCMFWGTWETTWVATWGYWEAAWGYWETTWGYWVTTWGYWVTTWGDWGTCCWKTGLG